VNVFPINGFHLYDRRAVHVGTLNASALMTDRQSLSPSLWPHPFVWSNFVQIFHQVPLLLYTWNTFRYAALSTVGTVVSCVPVAYALSRIPWRGRQLAFILVLSTLMLPSTVTVVPPVTASPSTWKMIGSVPVISTAGVRVVRTPGARSSVPR
jgi:ABC-type glycerol-3-phosphate transport system permease component